MALQISTWASPNFGDNEVKLLRFTKKLSVQAGTTSVGYIDAFVGITGNLRNCLEIEEGDPLQVSSKRQKPQCPALLELPDTLTR